MIQAGCFDCLKDALSVYQSVRGLAGAPPLVTEMATAGAVRAAALLALRERELGMVDSGYLEVARDLLPRRACSRTGVGCAPHADVLNIITALPSRPVGRPPASDPQLGNFGQVARNRTEWQLLLRDIAGHDLLTAYTWLSVACDSLASVEEIDAPVAALRDVPLLIFKRATCRRADSAALAELIAHDPRFVEVTYLLGSFAIAQRKLDDADMELQRAFAWHPQWPVLTFSIGNVAMTMEDFERALEFYDRTMALEPRAPDAAIGKVQALTYLGRYEPAIAVIDQLLDQRWYLGDAHYWRAVNELQLGRIDEAWVDIEKAGRLLINAEVPKLAGIIAYRRRNLDVARAKFDESRERKPSDCETGFYLGVVLAAQRLWTRTADVLVETGRCFEDAEQQLRRELEQIRRSDAVSPRQMRQITRREGQIASGRRMLAASWFNTAVADFNLARKADARQLAERLTSDDEFGGRAREILSLLDRDR